MPVLSQQDMPPRAARGQKRAAELIKGDESTETFDASYVEDELKDLRAEGAFSFMGEIGCLSEGPLLASYQS